MLGISPVCTALYFNGVGVYYSRLLSVWYIWSNLIGYMPSPWLTDDGLLSCTLLSTFSDNDAFSTVCRLTTRMIADSIRNSCDVFLCILCFVFFCLFLSSFFVFFFSYSIRCNWCGITRRPGRLATLSIQMNGRLSDHLSSIVYCWRQPKTNAIWKI